MSATLTRPSLADRYAAEFPGSRKLYEQARQVFPGGVTHDLRLMEPFPVYVTRAKGAHKWDVDGHELIDYFCGHGALLLGHSPDDVVAAVQAQMAKATHPGSCHESEIIWGQWVQKLVPSAERVRFTSSGTEATLMAIRLARIFTGRPKVLKFAGHFHGWHDAAMPAAYHPYDGSPVPGIPGDVTGHTVVIEPNDPGAVEKALRDDPQIGVVILEPTGGHWGLVPVRGEFLKALRELTTKYQRLLIFDEVITGFRVSPGGAQAHYGVTPDMTTLAKILAGGLPGGCVAGRADILSAIEVRPGKPKMRHPGTFNGNPLSAAAGITALKRVATGEPTAKANRTATLLRRKLNETFAERDLPWAAYGDFSLVHLFPDYRGPRPAGDDFIPLDGSVGKLDAPKNPQRVHAFRQAMLLNGVDLPGLGLFLTCEHTEADMAKTVEAVGKAAEALAAEGME
jgi:glutamate-1-semialdehyde 2,1-aminomutase